MGTGFAALHTIASATSGPPSASPHSLSEVPAYPVTANPARSLSIDKRLLYSVLPEIYEKKVWRLATNKRGIGERVEGGVAV